MTRQRGLFLRFFLAIFAVGVGLALYFWVRDREYTFPLILAGLVMSCLIGFVTLMVISVNMDAFGTGLDRAIASAVPDKQTIKTYQKFKYYKDEGKLFVLTPNGKQRKFDSDDVRIIHSTKVKKSYVTVAKNKIDPSLFSKGEIKAYSRSLSASDLGYTVVIHKSVNLK